MQLTALSNLRTAPQRPQASPQQLELPLDSFTLESPPSEPPVYRFTTRNASVDGTPVTLELRLPDGMDLNAFFTEMAPVVNPDGYQGWRKNEGIDLNRHYRESDLNAWYDPANQTINFKG